MHLPYRFQASKSLENDLIEEFRTLLRPDLNLPRPSPVTDRWLLASQLQKAIRRGMRVEATAAASALSVVDVSYLWRRLRVVALEDIGLGNLKLVAMVLAIAGKGRLHQEYGEQRVCSHVAAALAGAMKSRTACDMLVLGELEPVPTDDRQTLVRRGEEEWFAVAVDDLQPWWRRSLAMHLLGGMSLRTPQGFRTLSRLDPALMNRALEHLGTPPLVRYVVMKGRSTDGLNTSLPLADDLLRGQAVRHVQGCRQPASEKAIASTMAAAYCMYTRAGNQAFALLLRQDKALQTQLCLAGAKVPARALGYLVFHTEGGVLDRFLDCTAGRQLLNAVEAAERKYVGITGDAAHLYGMLSERMLALHACRRRVARMDGAQAALPGIT